MQNLKAKTFFFGPFQAVFLASFFTACFGKFGHPPQSSNVKGVDDFCRQNEIDQIELPYYYDRFDSPRFTLRYRIFPAASATTSTVIVLPGGPGGTLLSKSPADAFALGAVPISNYNIIYVDPRGAGCNALPQDAVSPNDTFYRSANLAQDVVEIVRQLGLNNYVIYGASFGSAHATMTASLLTRAGLPAPKAIVLEGVLGKAFNGFDAYFSSFTREWQRVRPMMPTVWRDAFVSQPFSSQLVYSSTQWGTFIADKLILGDFPRSDRDSPEDSHILEWFLEQLSANPPNLGVQAQVRAFMENVTNATTPLFATIACRELWGSWKSGRDIISGQLIATGPDICLDLGLNFEPYDSGNWQVVAPIYYFQGPFDPTTTLEQAQYHLSHHTSVARHYIEVPNAAHAPLTLGLRARGCSDAVWHAIMDAPEELQIALSSCTGADRYPVRLLSQAAN